MKFKGGNKVKVNQKVLFQQIIKFSDEYDGPGSTKELKIQDKMFPAWRDYISEFCQMEIDEEC